MGKGYRAMMNDLREAWFELMLLIALAAFMLWKLW